MVKTLIIGIDGATFRFIKPLLKEGKLPQLEKLINRGSWGICRSTIPPVTAAAWTTFLLSQNPGQHGAFGFVKQELKDYGQSSSGEFLSSQVLAGRTFLDYINQKTGQPVALITVPMTYPPWKIKKGVIISGYPCPDSEENFIFASPSFKVQPPQALHFSAAYYDSVSLAELRADEFQMIKARAAVALDLLQQSDFAALMIVFGATDRMQHEFLRFHEQGYPATEEERRLFRGAIEETYQRVDEAIGSLLQYTNEETNIIVLSDHGGQPKPRTYFNIQTWLEKEGYLQSRRSSNTLYNLLKSGLRSSRLLRRLKQKLFQQQKIKKGLVNWQKNLAAARFQWSQSRAYFRRLEFPAGGIVINLAGRQGQGRVSASEYPQLRRELKAKLKALRTPKGEKLFPAVYEREEIYQGPATAEAPDLIFLIHPDYLPNEEKQEQIFSPVPASELRKISGLHSMEGIFITAGPAFRQGVETELNLIDLAPHILAALNLPLPRHYEGKIKPEILQPQVKITYNEEEINLSSPASTTKLSADEKKQIKKKLERLGYL